jgi:hypothetical protein
MDEDWELVMVNTGVVAEAWRWCPNLGTLGRRASKPETPARHNRPDRDFQHYLDLDHRIRTTDAFEYLPKSSPLS